MAAVGLAAILSAESSAESRRVFRHVDIAPQRRLELGKRFPSLDRVAFKVNDETFRLKPGTFRGADAIEVRTSPAATIACIAFQYSQPSKLQELIGVYQGLLGPPDSHQIVQGRTAIEWVDTRTVFALIQDQGAAPQAVLIDMQSCKNWKSLTCECNESPTSTK
jgi:hypothetical protein